MKLAFRFVAAAFVVTAALVLALDLSDRASAQSKDDGDVFAEKRFESKRVVPTVAALDTFAEIVRKDANSPKPDMEYILQSKGKRPRNPPAEEMSPVPESLFKKNPGMFFDYGKVIEENPVAPQVASPNPNLDFQGLGDANTSIPPDTSGAVGPNHIMTALNTQVRIQSKTGTTVSTVSLNSFFSSVGGGGGTFDPRVVYDPYENRWICVAVDDAAAASSKVLIAVSQTNDPTGTWNFWGYDHDSANVEWADYPMVGFNKNWIVVTINDFTVAANAFSGANAYIFDKSSLYAAAPAPTMSKADIGTSLGNVHQPVETYDNTLETLYVIQRWSSAGGSLRVYTVTGTPAAPTFTATSLFPTSTAFSNTSVNAPQAGGSGITITNNDTRMQRAIYRNGSVWAAHTIFLTSPSRTSVQWWQFRPTDATVQQMGRVDDPTGTNFYAFPSIAVNAAGQALVGYSAFSPTTFASAAYSYRGLTDATSTTRDPLRYKNGIACYRKTFGGSTNRWGDYSNTVVDPTDDMTFWTLQEYAEAAVGGDCSTNNTGRWGVWWAKVIPPCSSVVTSGNWSAPATWGCGSVPTASDDAVVAKGQTVTLDTNPAAATIVVNEGGTLAVNGTRTLTSNLLVNGTLDLAGGVLDSGSNTITVGCGGSISNASATGYVRGNLRKEFCATGSFNYAVGTANGYSPVNANVTALGTVPSSLTITTVQTVHPALASSNSMSRYWTLTENGDVTVNLVFNYLQPDVNGIESGYGLYRITGGVPSAVTPFTLNTTANTMSVNGVSTFSDWSGGSLTPTAASVSVRGRVLNTEGLPVARATVTLTDQNGMVRKFVTGSMGRFEFTGVPVGDNYVLNATKPKLVFEPRVLNLTEDTVLDIGSTQFRR